MARGPALNQFSLDRSQVIHNACFLRELGYFTTVETNVDPEKEEQHPLCGKLRRGKFQCERKGSLLALISMN